jgi:hypothetical protein
MILHEKLLLPAMRLKTKITHLKYKKAGGSRELVSGFTFLVSRLAVENFGLYIFNYPVQIWKTTNNQSATTNQTTNVF